MVLNNERRYSLRRHDADTPYREDLRYILRLILNLVALRVVFLSCGVLPLAIYFYILRFS